ncbi:hypothetical protein [uncultured Microbacterium sp.]|uniref:hypothetical protein n=1 Tax=uncultured Microbacterium sp. TaxID=191216 RepID=UPI0026000980|nr:hypothetical protein [uncultured Microbacterium sp.]
MRTTNRLVLLLSGLVALAGAVLIALPLLPSTIATPVVAVVTDAVRAVTAFFAPWAIDVAGTGRIEGPVVAGAVAALVLALLLIWFLSTRRQGRLRTVLRVREPQGATTADEGVAQAVLAGDLADRADVLSATVRGRDVRHEATLRMHVVPRSGAPLRILLEQAQRACEDWAALAGERRPIVVHLADRRGWDRLRSATRVR